MMMFDVRVPVFDFFGWLFEAREEQAAYLWDSLLVDQSQSFIESVLADDSPLSRVKHDTAHAGVRAFCVIVLGKELLIFKDEPQRNVLVFEEAHFALHEVLVLFCGCLIDRLHKFEVTLATAQVHFGLHELDESLQDQVLHQVLIGS